MRNLTIKRAKSFVGCLGSAKIYVEAVDGDTKIGGVLCRKLGKLKNGQEETFQVPEVACRIYVIADKLSKGYSYELYQLPEGTEDVCLVGRNHYTPSTGNAFRFDNNDNEATHSSRKKGRIIGSVVLVAALVFGVLFGVFVGRMIGKGMFGGGDPKGYTVKGCTITLTERFREFEQVGFDACYRNGENYVLMIRESFDSVGDLKNGTLQDYAKAVIQTNKLTDTKVQEKEGVVFFEYTNADTHSDIDIFYFATVHKSNDAFWLIQFACPMEDKAEMMDDFLQWAQSVRFDEVV